MAFDSVSVELTLTLRYWFRMVHLGFLDPASPREVSVRILFICEVPLFVIIGGLVTS